MKSSMTAIARCSCLTAVGTGLAAAVAAIPTIAIARPDPIARGRVRQRCRQTPRCTESPQHHLRQAASSASPGDRSAEDPANRYRRDAECRKHRRSGMGRRLIACCRASKSEAPRAFCTMTSPSRIVARQPRRAAEATMPGVPVGPVMTVARKGAHRTAPAREVHSFHPSASSLLTTSGLVADPMQR